MSKGSDPPSGGQRGRARRDPTRAEWERATSKETEIAVNRAVSAFIRRHHGHDSNELHGVALDELMRGVVDYIEGLGVPWHLYIFQRILWALRRYRFTQRKHRALLAEHYETWPDPPEPDAWEVMGAAARLQQQQAAVALLDQLPFDHAYLIREHYLKGRAVKEIAKELGMSATAAGRLHHDALARLRVEMRRLGIAPQF